MRKGKHRIPAEKATGEKRNGESSTTKNSKVEAGTGQPCGQTGIALVRGEWSSAHMLRFLCSYGFPRVKSNLVCHRARFLPCCAVSFFCSFVEVGTGKAQSAGSTPSDSASRATTI